MDPTFLFVLASSLVIAGSAFAQSSGGGGGVSGAGSGASSSGTASSSTAGGRSGAPVATTKNPTFSSQGTSLPAGANRSGATITNPAVVGTVGGAQINAPGRGVGTAPNGVPIGNPGSGKGSPENPW